MVGARGNFDRGDLAIGPEALRALSMLAGGSWREPPRPSEASKIAFLCSRYYCEECLHEDVVLRREKSMERIQSEVPLEHREIQVELDRLGLGHRLLRLVEAMTPSAFFIFCLFFF